MAKQRTTGIKYGSATSVDRRCDGATALFRWSNHGCIIMPRTSGESGSSRKRPAKSLPIVTDLTDRHASSCKEERAASRYEAYGLLRRVVRTKHRGKSDKAYPTIAMDGV